MDSQGLIERFNLSRSDFDKPVPWIDGVGFSIIEDWHNGYASLYKIGFNKDNDGKSQQSFWLTASYGKKTENGISLGTGNNLKNPVDIEVHDEFFFNTISSAFIYRNKNITGQDILKKLRNAHLKPTKSIRGIPLILKLFFWRKVLPGLIKIFDQISILLLELFTGERVEDKDIIQRHIKQWHEESSRRPVKSRNFTEEKIERSIISPQQWSFLGFQSTRWSVVFYSITQILLYYINSKFWKIKDPIVINIFKNSFLTLCYVAISFTIIELLIPKILKALINKTPKIYSYVIFKRLKVSV